MNSTSLQRTKIGTWRLWTLGALLLLARDGWSITISPSPSYTGNYSVSFASTGCYTEWRYYPAYVFQVCKYLQERVGAGAWTNVATASGATSLNVTGKAPGSYAYQVYQTSIFGNQVVEPPVTVVVGTPPPRDSLLTQLQYQFQTRQGDINADGRTDFFIKRIAGGAAGNGVLDAAILRQSAAGGSFSAVAPTAYESSVASSWPLSSATAVVTDFNVDGFVDVEIRGVAAATGAAAAADQIVFSSGTPLQAQPLGTRAVDAALRKFVANVLDYIVNPNYFEEYASIQYATGSIPVVWCDWNSLTGVWDGWSYFRACQVGYIYVAGYYRDYSDFSSAAISIWNNDLANDAGAVSSNQSADAAQQAAEAVLQVAIGGWPMEEELGQAGDHTDAAVRRGLETFWAILGIGRANAQEVETDEAPAQVPRVQDVVYITGRYALGAMPAHTAIEYTSAFVGAYWVSAFAEFGPLPKLVAHERDPADSPRLMVTLGQVQEPGNPNSVYFVEVVAGARIYDDNLCYALDPPPGGSCYNSNGFIRGLVTATGGIPTIDLSIFPGGDNPVPAHAFE